MTTRNKPRAKIRLIVLGDGSTRHAVVEVDTGYTPKLTHSKTEAARWIKANGYRRFL